jgi:hypothetical protein
MQSGVSELHLGLDARQPGDPAAGRALLQVVEQCGLANPGFASHDEHLTVPRPCARDQIVEDPALAAPAVQRGGTIRTAPHAPTPERTAGRTTNGRGVESEHQRK